MTSLSGKNIKVLITDDHLVIQYGLAGIIEGFLPKSMVRFASSLEESLAMLKAEQFNLLILDINIPGGNNFQMIEDIHTIHPGIKILIFSAYATETYALRYFKAGVNAYLEKGASEDEIKAAIMSVLLKGKYLSPKVQDMLFEANHVKETGDNYLMRLTNRELEIARLIAKGEGTNSISHKLDLQASTVSTHKKNIFDKLKISNVSELITEFRLDYEI